MNCYETWPCLCCQSCWESPGISVSDVMYMLPELPGILRLLKHKMNSVLGESRLFLLVSLKRASVLLFMFCIAYVWCMDESFPYYIIENVIWVTENSLTNLYAELCSWGLLCTSLFVFEIFKQIWGDVSYGRVCVCVCVCWGEGVKDCGICGV